MAGLHSQWEGRGDDLTICTSNKFPSDADVAGPRSILRTTAQYDIESD